MNKFSHLDQKKRNLKVKKKCLFVPIILKTLWNAKRNQHENVISAMSEDLKNHISVSKWPSHILMGRHHPK